MQNSIFYTFMSKVPDDIKQTFTKEQLNVLESFLEKQECKNNFLDIRYSFPFIKKKYYFALLGGHNKENFSNKFHMNRKMTIFTAFSVLFIFVFFLFFLYLIKSGLGVDLIPNYSFGAWEWMYNLLN